MKKDTRLMAAMYLLTADQILWNKVKGNIRESRIDYDEVRLDTVSENCYTLYSASKDMYFNTDHVSLSDIFDTKTGEFVKQHINYPTPVDIDVYSTDSNGRLMMPEALKFGDYELIEVQTAYGYVLDSNPVKFKVECSI